MRKELWMVYKDRRERYENVRPSVRRTSKGEQIELNERILP